MWAHFPPVPVPPSGPGKPRRQRGPREPQRAKFVPAPLSPLYKTRLCAFFAVGACRAGPLCGYAHGEADVRPSPNFECTSICPSLLRSGVCGREDTCRYAHRSSDLKASPVMFKTKFCSFHFEGGGCIVGDACRFAHSAEELREASAVQNDAISRLPVKAEQVQPRTAARPCSSADSAMEAAAANRQARCGGLRQRALQHFVARPTEAVPVPPGLQMELVERLAAAARAAAASASAATTAPARRRQLSPAREPRRELLFELPAPGPEDARLPRC